MVDTTYFKVLADLYICVQSVIIVSCYLSTAGSRPSQTPSSLVVLRCNDSSSP